MKEIILKNKKNGRTVVIGDGRLKLNLSIGVSPKIANFEEELEKIRIGEKNRIDFVTDNSIGNPQSYDFYKKLTEVCGLPIGGLSVYMAENLALKRKTQLIDHMDDYLYQAFEFVAKNSAFVEIHPTLTKRVSEDILKKNSKRSIVSRSGGILLKLMEKNNVENPFFKDYDAFLQTAKRYNVPLIIGTCLRPGSLKDSFDKFHLNEIRLQKLLVEEANKAGVPVAVEVVGHIKPTDMNKLKKIRKLINAPIGALGPLFTDIALGMDDVAAGMGIVMAGSHLDWSSVITRTEHISLPTKNDVLDSIYTANLARHLLDLFKNQNYDRDFLMAEARENLNWDKMSEASIKSCTMKIGHLNGQSCSMCGSYCPLKVKNGI
jgi:phosphomethylpyrimidine synthase